MKGPGIFLAQFGGDAPPFDRLDTMARWTAEIPEVDGIRLTKALLERVRDELA